jgi:hypothetical protein
MVGHHDRRGLFDTDSAKSWNAAHPSRGSNGGCSQEGAAEHRWRWVILLLHCQLMSGGSGRADVLLLT